MTDMELTAALGNLGLNRHNYRAVALIPLIEVAWADGRVQRAERKLIARIATTHGLDPGEAWLEKWLSKRPTVSTFLAARTVLLALMARSSDRDSSAPETLHSLLDLCLRVAEAAGGLFGLAFTVERAERQCIEEIAASLALGPALPQGIVRAWQTIERPAPAAMPTARRSRPKRAPRQKPSRLSEATTRVRPSSPRGRASPPPDPLSEDITEARPIRHVGIVRATEPARQGAAQDTFEDDPTVPFDDGLVDSGPIPFLLADDD